ncbi:MAG TPA: hypothetical protein VNU93_05815 [Verrucomicrobiae bacterium]|nr:hypothetical protein [Verrucomicrobiae bacterium]
MCDEWKGCTLGTQWVRRTLHPLDAARDYNYVGQVSRLLKAVQGLDTDGIYGQRSVQISRHRHVLEGFSITRKTLFDALLSAPLTCIAEKETLSAQVQIPHLLTGMNLYPQTLHPYFRIITTLGIIPDIHYTPLGYAPKVPAGAYLPHVVATDWTGVKKGVDETELHLQLPYNVEYPSFCLVVGVAICFGTPDGWGNIQSVKYCGSGRVVKVV